jgi:hypothetical protein
VSKACEHQHQKALITWFKLQYPKKVIFAIPNGGKRSPIEAKKLKAEGVLAGVSDLFFPEGKLFIEMKATKGRVAPAQSVFMLQMVELGYNVVVCYSFLEAKECIERCIKQSLQSQVLS